jgi:hypothetical protein
MSKKSMLMIRIKSFCSSRYARYKLRSKNILRGMTLYHIEYVDVGKALVLLGTNDHIINR